MEMPKDATLAYVVSSEAWYAKVLTDRGPDLLVMASADGGGVHWEFTVVEKNLSRCRPSIQVRVFDDAFLAFAAIPEFFAALASKPAATLTDVRTILDDLGAVDQTQRTDPEEARRG